MTGAPKYQWQPTTVEIAAMAGIAPSDVERFDQNTSPYPSIWAEQRAQASSRTLNEYPAASYMSIRDAVGSTTGLPSDHVVPGAGADELILLSARAFLDPGARAVAPTPTYPMYLIATAQAGAEFVEVPAAGPDFAFPADRFLQAAQGADLAWVCVPNNPTSATPDDETMEALLARARVVVVDAAYAEFAGDEWAGWVRRHRNLVVLHTMSKAYGLAGARVGYALAQPELISAFDGIRPPGSIGSISVDLALAGLEDPARMRATVASLIGLRDALADDLSDLGLRVLPSRANFLLCEVGTNAGALQDALMREGLVVRKFPSGGPLDNYLRFTVRTEEAHARLISALERNMP